MHMKSLLRLFLLAIMLLSGPLARASLLSSINYFSCSAGCAPSTFVFVNSTAPDGSALAYSNAYGAVSAQAGYGTLKANVDSTYAGSSLSTGSSLAQFSDWIMFGGLSGPQMVTVLLHLDGTLGATGAGTDGTAASMAITMHIDGNQLALVADYFGNLAALQSASQAGLPGTYELDYGTQIPLDALLQVTGSYGGFAHFGNTVTLEFIVPQGTTIQSGSGTNYRLTTIPEPASAALLLLGLAAFATAKMGRRYKHPQP